jgi:fumarate hydratase class II
MPGKVNPVIPEAVTQVAAQVFGNDAAVAFGGSQGTLELNVFMPMMADNLLESIRLLSNVSRVFADKCIDGIEADVEQCRAYAESSPSIGTSLNPYIGYEKAAEVIKRANKENKTIREVVLEEGLMGDEELTKALDIAAMTRGGIIR